MRIAALIARVFLGLIFVVFGLNKLAHFIHVPMPPGDAGLYYALLFGHHMMAVVGCIEALAGVLLLVGRFVPLSLVLLGPIVVNILLYEALFNHAGPGAAIVVTVLELFLLWIYRNSFRGVLSSNADVS